MKALPRMTITRKVRVLLSVYYAEMLTYRAEIYLWVIASILPFIMMSIWTKAAQSTAGGNFSMSPLEYGRYFLAVFIVRQFTLVWFIYDFEWRVVEGRLSYNLLRPMAVVWNFVAAHLGEQMARFPFVVFIVGLFFCIYPQTLWTPSPTSVLAGVLAIYAAFATRFALQYCIAMVTFWFERASALEQLSMLPYWFLSGMIIPLGDFSPRVAGVLRFTPFPYFVDFPARIITGRIGLADERLYEGFGMMAAWFVIFVLIGRLLWNRGLRHYSGQGA